ncbi:MAG: reprolysin-like metallopeptidase, partial [Blastocatellia bacterium]
AVHPMTDFAPSVVAGTTLRTYRLAVAATGEFTQQYGGGSVTQTQTAIAQNVNLINAIYQKELSIRFTLIDNTSIIFTDPNTDGYTNSNPGTMLTENQTKLDAVIGSANYDIGHVYGAITGLPAGSRSFSGIAFIGVACTAGQKGKGASTMGGGSTTDTIFVTGITHEFGHELGASHTFNTNSSPCGPQRSAQSAWEPGGGSTLMAYSICGAENLQPSTDQYFHTGSLEQIISYVTSGGTCAAQSSTGNHPPLVEAGPNYTIPSRTPFALTAMGSDPDGDPLTYAWEEYDLGTASPPNTDDGSRPIFRSYPPVTSPTRLFPSLKYILNNANDPPQTYVLNGTTYTTGEALPTTNRIMNFRVTARDNRAAGGGIQSDAMQVTIIAAAGPFQVTQPNTAVSWAGGSTQTVTWNVAGTTASPVNAANVRVLLSTDGGNTFPIVILPSTPNDGSEPIRVPNAPTAQARVKIQAVGNIFFDVSDANFTITAGTGGVFRQRTDIDGDLRSDIGTYRDGLWNFLQSSQGYSTNSPLFFSWGGAGKQPIIADFDGDGRADIGYIEPPAGGQSATYAILLSSRNYSFASAQPLFVPAGFPSLGDTPVVGDFDGDGKYDPGIWRESQGVWIIPKSSSNYTQFIFLQWGQSGDVPVVGDFDGDHLSDIGYYRNGVWGILQSSQGYSTNSPLFFSWGGVGLAPIVADFDGDGKSDLAYVVPPASNQSAVYSILKSSANYSTGQPLFVPAGFPSLGDTPVVGDYDGDGKADPGIWRSSQAVWIIPKSSSNYTQFIIVQWGQTGDIPLPRVLAQN